MEFHGIYLLGDSLNVSSPEAPYLWKDVWEGKQARLNPLRLCELGLLSALLPSPVPPSIRQERAAH